MCGVPVPFIFCQFTLTREWLNWFQRNLVGRNTTERSIIFFGFVEHSTQQFDTMGFNQKIR